MTKNKYSGEYTLETNIKYTKGLVNIFFAGKEANPFTGNAYALQFGDSSNIKLFRFAGDDIKTENMGKNINDGNYHNIKITKTTNSVVVYVDGTEYLSHTFDTVEDFYNNAHAGIGLWDGALEVQGFKKAPDEGPSDPANTPGNPTNAPISPVKNSSKKPIKNITVNNTKYKVTSVKNTQTVQVTGIKKNTKNIVIPPAVKIKGKNYKVTSIAKNTFKGNKKLTEITIGKNISSIGKNAFKGCNNLKNIKIKTTKLKLKNVGNNAFKGINSKAKIKAPKSKVKLYKKIVKAKGAGKNVKVSKLK